MFGSDLLRIAQSDGLNEELAIAIAEKLAQQVRLGHLVGTFHFNRSAK
jgi:hypothetical protein